MFIKMLKVHQGDCENMHVRIDEVVKNKEDVQALGIQNGDYIAYDPKTEITESGFIKSRFLDDKISVAILFGMLKHLANNHIKPKHNLIIIISTYEEVGHGSSYIHPNIDELIAVDMGCIGEDLACSEYDVSICAKDGSGPYDYDLTSNSLNLQVHISYNTLLIFILITAVMFQPLYVVVKILKAL